MGSQLPIDCHFLFARQVEFIAQRPQTLFEHVSESAVADSGHLIDPVLDGFLAKIHPKHLARVRNPDKNPPATGVGKSAQCFDGFAVEAFLEFNSLRCAACCRRPDRFTIRAHRWR